MITSKKLYDVLKNLAQIWLPAAGTLYFALAQIWDLPAADEVVATVLAVDTFLGVVLGISTAKYNNSDAKYDGNVVVTTNPDTGLKNVSLELNDTVPLDNLESTKDLTLKVTPSVDPPV
jgi:hypothetical protein